MDSNSTNMETRFFITDVYIPAGCRTMEHNLAKLAEPYIDHILSYDAMLRLADKVAQEQTAILKENKRLKPVDISVDLDGDYYSLPGKAWRFFRIGQVSVQFRLVKGEII